MAYLLTASTAIRQRALSMAEQVTRTGEVQEYDDAISSDSDSDGGSKDINARAQKAKGACMRRRYQESKRLRAALHPLPYMAASHGTIQKVWAAEDLAEFVRAREALKRSCIKASGLGTLISWPRSRDGKELERHQCSLESMIEAQKAEACINSWFGNEFGARVLSTMQAVRTKFLAAAAEFMLGTAGAAALDASFLRWRLPGLMVNAMSIMSFQHVQSSPKIHKHPYTAQGFLKLTWQSPDSIEVWLHEQRLQALMFECLADELQVHIFDSARLWVSVHIDALRKEVGLTESELDSLAEIDSDSDSDTPSPWHQDTPSVKPEQSGNDPQRQLSARARRLKLQAKILLTIGCCPGVSLLHVAAHCQMLAADLCLAGQRIGCGDNENAQPWRKGVVVADGLWAGKLADSPLALAVTMLVLRKAMEEGRLSVLHLSPRPAPSLYMYHLQPGAPALLPPGRETHALLLSLAAASSREGKWPALQVHTSPSMQESKALSLQLLATPIAGSVAWDAASELCMHEGLEDLCMRLLAPYGHEHIIRQTQMHRSQGSSSSGSSNDQAHPTGARHSISRAGTASGSGIGSSRQCSLPEELTQDALLTVALSQELDMEDIMHDMDALLDTVGGFVLPAAAWLGSRQLRTFFAVLARVQQHRLNEHGRQLVVLPVLLAHKDMPEEAQAIANFRCESSQWSTSGKDVLQAACKLLYELPHAALHAFLHHPLARHCDAPSDELDAQDKKQSELLLQHAQPFARFGQASSTGLQLRALRLVVLECPESQPDKPCMPKQGQELEFVVQKLTQVVERLQHEERRLPGLPIADRGPAPSRNASSQLADEQAGYQEDGQADRG